MLNIIKTIITAILITFVAWISKKSPTIGGIVVSLPITSMLAMMWLYVDTKDNQVVMELSNSVVWALIPSILFFICMSFLLKKQLNFYLAMLISSGVMAGGYYIYVKILGIFGIQI
ncbi:DUF3147 family protein [Vallitalea okinawensis]|uniref:DUF3147 family protein n=1 Tax=Vallitalea okinawensis TaxID=2078660 RepID=UPI000CFC2C8E|nr:DUF3147 family protein [Vallitalea okinawensis]